MLRFRPAQRRAAPGPSPGGTGDVQLLRRLTGLRAFAALAVFVLHLDVWGVASLPWRMSEVGASGVAFFFVLSGFVLAWGTAADIRARTFFRRRFARVYPSDVVVLLVATVVPVVAVHRDAEAALANALMLQAWFADGDVVYGMNGVSWSLSCEAFFYAIFPVAALVVRRLPRRIGWALALLGLGLAVVAYQLDPSRAYSFPPIRASEFLLGLVAGIAFREGWRPRIPGASVWAGLVLSTAVSVWLASPVINVVMAVPFLLLIVHMAGRDVEARSGWLAGRTLVFAGEASFAFYLVHELVIVNMLPLMPDEAAVQVPVMSAVAVVAAVTLHLLVERPCNRLLRDRVPSVALATLDGEAETGSPRGGADAEAQGEETVFPGERADRRESPDLPLVVGQDGQADRGSEPQ